jgi:hypothetical protein
MQATNPCIAHAVAALKIPQADFSESKNASTREASVFFFTMTLRTQKSW